MVAIVSPFVIFLSLFATSPQNVSNSNNRKRRKTKQQQQQQQHPNNSKGNDINFKEGSAKRTGRRRYSRSGDKIRNNGNSNSNSNSNSNNNHKNSPKMENGKQQDVVQQAVHPMPELTTPSSLRPTYFTCRHTYEETLISEIQRYVDTNSSHKKDDGVVSSISPYPGLVRVEDEINALPPYYDPVYALQTIPNAVVVSGTSIKTIATSIFDALLGHESSDNSNKNDKNNENDDTFAIRDKLRSAPRGSLSIHALVPGMCKGQTKPIMLHRSEKVGEELTKMLRKGFPAARKKAPPMTNDDDDDDINSSRKSEIKTEEEEEEEKWLLQFMLQDNTIVIASLTQCQQINNDDITAAYWPNWYHPLGLPNVDMEEKMPSSAYRKLMEGIECMKLYPTSDSNIVDLGACPGGWTAVVRKLFDSSVTAIDRSKLDPSLMKDDKVSFVKGDAFAFVPEQVDTTKIVDDDNNNNNHYDTWMISDVIAYPERCTELLDNWCKEQWAQYMVVTMKFQGDEPAFVELDNAIDIVKGYGYNCRVKHFFNNKNEVTFMVSKKSGERKRRPSQNKLLGRSFYPRILP